MPTFDITEDAFKLVAGGAAPEPPIPALSDPARTALEASERYTRAGTLIIMRRITADTAAAKELRDWFVHAQDVLSSGDELAGSRSRLAEAAADAILRAIVSGRPR